MELLIAFIIFIISMVAALVLGKSMLIALLIGLAAFLTVGRRKGFSLKSMMVMSWEAIRDSLVVIEVMLVIGLLTAVWRISGTITIFVYYGMKVITPPLFLLVAFLLSCLLSYAIGTSFGVAGTLGVIFMALARSGGVDPTLAAGVILSGVYFGDRCSPVASSANMVASITKTDIYGNVKMMMKTATLPFFLTLAVYGAVSVMNPVSHVDPALVRAFEGAFSLSLWAFAPAVIVVALPLMKVKVIKTMATSIAAGVLVAFLVQNIPLLEILRTAMLGYEAVGEGLGAILNGGGLLSMLEVVGILIISSAYSGIFSGTDMLKDLLERLNTACGRFGRFPVMVMVSIAMGCTFCNQTISTLMCSDLMTKPYLDNGGSREELAIDIENSVILLSCAIPWSIGCSVPLAFLGADLRALPFAIYLYAVPVCYWLTKKRWYPLEERES